MKTLYLILLILAMRPVVAQTKFFNIHGGPKIGACPNLPEGQVWFTDKLRLSSNSPNAYAGAFIEFGFGKHLALQTEVTVAQFAYDWEFENFTIVEKYSFISIPAIMKFKFGGFAIYGGYQWDKFNFAERKMDDLGVADPDHLDKLYEYDWHSANAMYVNDANSFVVGIEYTTRMGVGFSVRYVKGLTNLVVTERRKSIYRSGDEIYNTHLSIGVHWSFGKRRTKDA